MALVQALKTSPSQAAAGAPSPTGASKQGQGRAPSVDGLSWVIQPTLKTSCDPRGRALSPHWRCLRSGFAPDLVESSQRATERSFAATLAPQHRRWLAEQSAWLLQQGCFDALEALAAEWDDDGRDDA